ncbi:MAG: aspartate aminotransferase family protein [Chitinophagales bacterium]|nr:aspartate aminotransferase family protein [Chitinophagales bacterium]
MHLFDVYPLFDLSLIKGNGAYVYDDKGHEYLDFYGGHAVISVGHNHPKYTQALQEQLEQLAYYSNSVHLPLQAQLATKLGEVSGYTDYQLFLCNSGAEANENAIKLASFHTGKKKIIAFQGAFHGRTHGAVVATDSKKIKAPINNDEHVIFLPFNDIEALENTLRMENDICAVIIEPIQGVQGIYEATPAFLSAIQRLCKQHHVIFIADEIQCGYGRTGKFFAHQWANVQPDIITIAKGMGNGFPVAGALIHPDIHPSHGLLGTTFGGAPLACRAALSVLEIIENENLIANALHMGDYLKQRFTTIEGIREIRGKGLMLGIEFNVPIKEMRHNLVKVHKIFTGNANQSHTLRLLPPLNITKNHVDTLMDKIISSL